ncbi:transglutaminase-like domain-containing protein [Nitratifractor salsuginis]|uniref:Transglutaminase domain-containing protein n=1 Tax=Nitratifractor salsuginis (strain DSM 16511 / JCM 12458 / E9I37-1) TaxID=749222 RepID=E6WZJ9_NITSE|nr:transglutaminase domain-containing protein [Nitratifractor salsuginis]ADV45579.1 transglutaminase domain-containing protein [Nitratifractor salsuginis DSM 16511]
MQRRDFLKTLSVAAAASLLGSAGTLQAATMAPESEEEISREKRRFRVRYSFDLKNPDGKGPYPARLWNPMPYQAPWQNVRILHFDGNMDEWNLNDDNSYDVNILYAGWKKSPNPKKLEIEMEIETRYRSVPLEAIEAASKKNLPIPEEVQRFLKPTAHIPTDGKIKAKADELTQGISDCFEKVKKIYDWVTLTTFRDPKVVGCGSGDAGKMMNSGYFGGKCTDISSLFVALLRAAGIPAREVFGIRLGLSHYSKALGKADDKGFADITTWQHCRAEYYIPGLGWVPSDPADITKLELVESRKYNDPKVQELKRRYLHSWEMNWVGFNWGRDFILSPKPEQYPINMLGYPYAEVEDEPLDYYFPKEFAYHITSQEITKK